MNLKTLKLITTCILTSITIFESSGQTVKRFAGKAYIGTGNYTVPRSNHRDSTFFSAPTGIDIDTAGIIYLSNEHNIMAISGTTCKLIAGYNLDPHSPGAADSKDGTGTFARFSNPSGINVHPGTNELFIADVDNHQIRKVSAFYNLSQDPQVSTFAGVKLLNGSYLNSTNAASKFNGPVGVAVAANGDVFVADRNNHCIRKISGGNVTTIGGKQGVQSHVNGVAGTSTFNAPFNVYVDGNFLFVADYGNNAIRKIDLSDNTTTDFITSGLSYPSDLCKAGNAWFIAQQTCIRKFENNVLSLYAGSASQTGNIDSIGTAARFGNISAITYNPKQNMLYVVDKEFNIVKSITPSTRPVCNFTSSNVAPTKGQTIILSNTSTNKADKFKWTITPSSFNLLNNSQLTDSLVYLSFSQTGSYTVKLWVSNAGGADSLTKNSYINVSSVTAAPNPEFIASKTNPAVNEIISLIDQSANEPTEWKWRISPLTFIYENGTDSTSRIPNIKFTNGDNYSVTLIVSNSQGSATLTKTNYINVNASSLKRLAVSEPLLVFPNPGIDYININHPSKGILKLMNMSGQTVGEWQKQEYSSRIEVMNLAPGLYYIQLQTSEGNFSHKVMVDPR